MQILHWLFKRPHDFSGAASTPCGSSRECQDEVKQRYLVVYNKVITCDEDEVENDATFKIVLRRQNSRTFLYSTLQLKHLRSLFKSQSLWKQQQEDSESRMAANVGCKVLPLCDAVSTASKCGDSSDGSDKDVQKSDRRKAVSRMKELLRWAAAAKSPSKGGTKGWKALYFRHKVTLKAEVDDSSSSSSKISFKWDAGSCSSASSVHSPLSLASASRNEQHMLVKNLSRLSVNAQSSELDPNLLGSPKSEDYVRNGQWITTDSEFVVLEL